MSPSGTTLPFGPNRANDRSGSIAALPRNVPTALDRGADREWLLHPCVAVAIYAQLAVLASAPRPGENRRMADNIMPAIPGEYLSPSRY
jgi:hypothetical protein